MRRILFSSILIVALGTTSAHPSPALPATLRVAAASPAPGSVLTQAPTQILLTLDGAMDTATVGTASLRIVRRGPDGVFDTADDVPVTPVSVMVRAPQEIAVDLSGLNLPSDQYRVTLSGTSALPSNLVHRWTLDEATGPTIRDAMGNAPAATLTGPTWSTGRLGSAIHFANTEDRVVLGLGDLASPWTASMWVRREDAPREDARLLDSLPATGSLRLEQYNHTNRPGLTRYGAFDRAFSYTATVGTWVNLTFVGTGSATSLYVNGVFQESVPETIDCPRYSIGSQGWNSIQGDIDEIQIYSRVLTDAEVRTVAGLGGAIRDAGGSRLDGEYTGALPSGDGSEGGDFVTAFTLNAAVPAVPTNLSGVAASTTQIALNWTDASDNETGFVLERSLDGVVFVQVASLSAGSSQYTDSGLTSGTLHYYRLRAFNTIGPSANTAVISVTTASPSFVVVSKRKKCGLTGAELLVFLVLLLRRRRIV